MYIRGNTHCYLDRRSFRVEIKQSKHNIRGRVVNVKDKAASTPGHPPRRRFIGNNICSNDRVLKHQTSEWVGRHSPGNAWKIHVWQVIALQNFNIDSSEISRASFDPMRCWLHGLFVYLIHSHPPTLVRSRRVRKRLYSVLQKR